ESLRFTFSVRRMPCLREILRTLNVNGSFRSVPLPVLLASLGEHALDRHRSAPLTLALVRRFHERKHLDGLLGADGRHAGAEELADLGHERLVAGVLTGRGDALVAEYRGAVARRALANPTERADAAVLPHAGHQVRVAGVHARHRLAAGAHDREQR